MTFKMIALRVFNFQVQNNAQGKHLLLVNGFSAAISAIFPRRNYLMWVTLEQAIRRRRLK